MFVKLQGGAARAQWILQMGRLEVGALGGHEAGEGHRDSMVGVGP